MPQFLKRLFKKKCFKTKETQRPASLRSRGGQIAIILILVIAAALVFFAVSLNLGRLSLTKTLVTVASNTSASMLASDMASYGQQLSSTSLQGGTKLCGWTGIMAALITVVAIIAVIGLSFICGVCGVALAKSALVVVGVVLAVASIIMQAVVLQPGLTEAWNRITQETLTQSNQFTESAIQSAMGKAVTDIVKVPDVTDEDGDRIWVTPALPLNPPFDDRISRYGKYYSKRLEEMNGPLALAEIDAFIDALKALLYVDVPVAGDWGIYDPLPPQDCVGKAECHACCFPDTIRGVPGFQSTNCTDIGNDAYWAGLCGPASPYGNAYPWIYDAYYENPDNASFSFRELIGRDDEHRDYWKNPADPNSDPAALPGPGRNPQFAHVGGQEGFRLEDTTGFYAADNLEGIYPFFYKMADWGVDLANVPANVAADATSRECHWCDQRFGGNCVPCAGLLPHPLPPEIAPQLALPIDPATLAVNTTYFVDGFVPDTGDPPLAVDKITLPLPGNIIAEPPDNNPASMICAQDQIYPPPGLADGFWRRGGDRFCDAAAAYHLECEPKCNGTPDCECSNLATDPSNFPEDVIDDIVYGLADFINWAERLIKDADNDMGAFVDDFPNWYADAALWIEPLGGPCFPPACVLTLPDGTIIPEGRLHIWLKEMTEMRDRIQGWIDNDGVGYGGLSCTEAWCVPSVAAGPCAEVSIWERASFNVNGGIRGDVGDIVDCLLWNVNDPNHGGARGNFAKFQACSTTCNGVNCSHLPRSLVPGLSTIDMSLLSNCFSDCNNANCQIMPWPGPGPGYFPALGDPSLIDFDATQCGAGWVAGNPWYDRLVVVINGICADPLWKPLLDQSVGEARNQVAKFQKRYDFLNNRLTEATDIIDILQDAIDQFDAFFVAADALIQARIDFTGPGTSGLPFEAVYGWKDEDTSIPGGGIKTGRWHIVKTEARIPGRCETACGVSQAAGSDPAWPRIITYTKNWGTKRCYELVNTSGSVKFRTTRYDEDRSGFLKFPNGVPFWQVRSYHPSRGLGNAFNLGPICSNRMILELPDTTATNIFAGAFIMNERNQDILCWDLSHTLLSTGVVSETCAEYYWHNLPNVNKGMGLKFVPCLEF